MLQKNAITEVPPNSPGFYSNVFLVRKASGGWRPVIDLKNLNAHIHAPHFRMFTTSSVLSYVRKGDYTFKIDQQDAYFHIPIHPGSRKYLRKQGVPVSGATIQSEHSPSGFYSIWAQGNRIPAPSGDLGDTISRRLVYSPPRPPSFNPTSSSAIEYARPCRLYSEQKEIRAGPDSGPPVSRNSLTSGPRGGIAPRVQSLGDSYTRTPSILPQSTNLFSGVPAYGVTQLSLRSYPNGSSYLRPLQRYFHSLGLTDRFTPPRQSDPLVLANLLRQWQDPSFLTSGIQIRTFQADLTIFTDASTQGWGARMGDSKISGTWTRTDRKLHINCLELKAVILPYSIGLLCFRASRL